jgi:uncharacterized membrane protein YgcG
MSGGQARRGCCAALAIALAALSGCDKQSSERAAARAAAAVVLSPPYLHNNTGPIPGNGGLLIWTQFSGAAPTVEVRSEAALEAPIAGTVRELFDSYWVWTANATMPEGTYAVHISNPSLGDSMDTIEVTAPRIFGKPALMSSPSAEISEGIGDYTCCWNLLNQVRIDMSCFGASTTNYITLFPHVTTTESASALTQLLFSDAGDLARPQLFNGSIESRHIEDQADEYCFDLVVTEIVTGERYTFEELDKCAPHGELPDFAERPLEPTDGDLDRLRCPGPPAGYEQRWCELNDPACAAEPTSAGCELAGHVCRGEPLPEPMMTTGGAGGTSGTGGTTGAAGMAGGREDPFAGSGSGGSGGSGNGNVDPDDPQPEPARHVTACSVSSAGAPEPRAWPALLGAALCLLLLRRRVRARTPTRAALLALLALLGACAERSSEPPSASAAALVLLSPPILVNNTAPIPGNGSLLIWTPHGDEPTLDMRSTTAPEAALAGSLRKLGAYWVWTADSTLPEGSYTVAISDPTFQVPTQELVDITAERTFQKPALTADPQIAINEVLAQYACCWSLVNNVRADGLCFAVEWQEGVLLSTNVATSESPSALTQLLFHITAATQPMAFEPAPLGSGANAFTFEAQADAYCFDVVAIEIATGERYTFEELERCVPHDMRALETRAVEHSAGDLDLTVCPAPPDGFEESWCEVNDMRCMAEPGRPGCELAGHVCHGEPLPGSATTDGGSGGTGGMVSSGGASGASGMSGQSGSGDDDASGPTGGRGERDESSPPDKAEGQGLRTAGCGCRVYPPRESSAWPALALLAAAIGLLGSAARSRFRASSDPGRSP